MLKYFAANRKRQLSALPNVGPYKYDVKISGFTRNFIYIHNISRRKVKAFCPTSCFHPVTARPVPQ
jgi:hypothetical protein